MKLEILSFAVYYYVLLSCLQSLTIVSYRHIKQIFLLIYYVRHCLTPTRRYQFVLWTAVARELAMTLW